MLLAEVVAILLVHYLQLEVLAADSLEIILLVVQLIVFRLQMVVQDMQLEITLVLCVPVGVLDQVLTHLLEVLLVTAQLPQLP